MKKRAKNVRMKRGIGRLGARERRLVSSIHSLLLLPCGKFCVGRHLDSKAEQGFLASARISTRLSRSQEWNNAHGLKIRV